MSLRDMLVSSALLWWAGADNDRSSAVCILGSIKAMNVGQEIAGR